MFSERDRQRVRELENRVSKLEGLLEGQQPLQGAHTELIKAFQKLQDQYTEGLNRARQAVDEIQASAPTFSTTPLYSSEEEEDLEAQVLSGVIDDEDYRRALRESGSFPNISIDK